MTDHLVVFDTQIHPGINLDFCSHIGNYILEHKPEKIIVIGDWWDMPSLSSYDKEGSKKAAGRNYQADIDSGVDGMRLMLGPMFQYNLYRRTQRKSQYRPEMHFTMGNHEERIMRFVNDNPRMEGKVGYQDLQLEKMGFRVHDFLVPAIIDGVQYIHYVKNKNSRYPKASAKATVEQTMMSTVQGHKPGLDVYVTFSDLTGRNVWSIINGSSYTHDEGFRNHTGNQHWRGIAHFKNVVAGDFDPVFISMDTLKQEYGQ